jgi:SpoIID/LytB domain protein
MARMPGPGREMPIASVWDRPCRGRSLISLSLISIQFLLSILILVPLAGLSAAQGQELGSQPVMRVGLVVNKPSVTLSCEGEIRVWRRGSGRSGSVFGPYVTLKLTAERSRAPREGLASLAERAAGWATAITTPGGNKLGLFGEDLVFEPASAGKPLKVDGKPYRGEVVVITSGPGTVTAVNAIHIEDYLKGVVPLEIGQSPAIPVAALKAQAIAARSYSLYYLGRRADEGFDLYADPLDQVYGGIEVETDRTSHAVISTQGGVAVYDGEAIRANYCSTCGGVTESCGSAWRGQKYPYLRAVKDRINGHIACENSRRFRWDESWSTTEFAEIILHNLPNECPEAKGKRHTRLVDIKVTKRSRSKRVEVMEIETDAGRFRIYGDRVRWVIRLPNGRLLWSNLFGPLKRDGDRVTLSGAGYGHGVGMCQYGVIERAKAGHTAPQILRHYYRDITLEKWW